MIEQFYDLKPQVLELDRKTLELCRDQFAHLVQQLRRLHAAGGGDLLRSHGGQLVCK